MPIGTYVDTRTISVAATTSGTLTHGLSQAPHMVWAAAKGNRIDISSTQFPYFSVLANSASLTVFNRGVAAETWTVCSWFIHTLAR